MEYQIIILTFFSIFASSSAILSEKPAVINVTEENQEEFALPLGTKLFLDERTQLYIPPPLAKNFTAKNRMQVQWFNKNTRYNYCKVGPDIKGWSTWFGFMLYTWCRDKDGEDMCCGNKKCSCNWFQANCACVSPKQFDYYEKKKDRDLDVYLYLANTAVDKIFETTPKPKAGKNVTDAKAPSEPKAADDTTTGEPKAADDKGPGEPEAAGDKAPSEPEAAE